MVEKEDAVEMVDLVLDRTGLEPGGVAAVAIALEVGGLQHDPLGPGHVTVDLRNREAALLGGGFPLALQDHGVDHDEPVAVGVDHRDPPGDPHLVRRQPYATRGVHGLEHVAHQPAHLVVGSADLFAAPAKDGRAEQVQREQAHAGVAPGAVDPPMRTMRERSTTTVAVPVSNVTRVSLMPSLSTSLMSRTLPTSPPLVITSSPFLRFCSRAACRFLA